MIKLTAREIAEVVGLKESYVRFLLHKRKIRLIKKDFKRIIEFIEERHACLSSLYTPKD